MTPSIAFLKWGTVRCIGAYSPVGLVTGMKTKIAILLDKKTPRFLDLAF